ncbi:MAG: hypothetical protein ABEJ34_05890 [Haloferacaceae archaeon]
MEVPDDPPSVCPVCEAAYDTVSVHHDGLMVNLRESERYRRVCLEPVEHESEAAAEFYHHTHAQVRNERQG